MNITIFSPGFPPWKIGGEEYYTYYQVKCLLESGNKVDVICENASTNDHRIPKNDDEKFQLILLKKTKFRNLLIRTVILTLRYIFGFLKIKNRPDIIHGHDILGPGLASVVIGKIYSIPVVITWHGTELIKVDHKFSILGDFATKFVCKHADNIIVSSENLKKLALHKVGKSFAPKFIIISPAVDTNEFKPDNDGSIIRKKYKISNSLLVLSVGRLERLKGFDILIEAIPQVLEKIPDTIFMIVGDGSQKENMYKSLSKLKLQDKVIMTGFVDRRELPSYYSACDVFVVPTRGEGFGMVFLEAWASMKPIITTPAAPIIANLIKEKGGGIVSLNTPEKIGASLISLLSDKKKRSKMGEAGRGTSLNFSWKNMVHRQVEIYKKLI